MTKLDGYEGGFPSSTSDDNIYFASLISILMTISLVMIDSASRASSLLLNGRTLTATFTPLICKYYRHENDLDIDEDDHAIGEDDHASDLMLDKQTDG